MEIFTKKNLILKIVIALVFVILFNFCAPTVSNAGFFDEIGGTLLEPIVELFIAIGDAAINLVQNLLFGLHDSVIKVATRGNDIFDTISKIVVGGLAIAVAIIVPGIGAGIVAGVATLAAGTYAASVIENTWLPEVFYLPVYAISPEEIFQNRIPLLDVNFFNPNQYEKIETVSDDESREPVSTASELQGVISSWYLALRNLAIVILLSVLLYTGIKIITSSAAQDKAKYKEKLSSWITAVCLLFFMHYIMAFATTIVEAISEGINKVNAPIAMELPDLGDYYIELRQENEESGEAETVKADANQFFTDSNLVNDQGKFVWPTNLMGQVRLEMQWEPPEYTDDNLLLRKLGYTVLYLILVFYTIGFLVMYVKRVIMLAFLTMMAPLVAMTYPLDKMSDGNAQAFNMWLKEYVFNLLIQPLHLILYTMLVGSAIEFAKDNLIYAIVALGFILQAEKIMRKFFGFDKASTVESGSTAALGGALAMAGINQIKKIGGGAARKARGGGSGDTGSKDKAKIRTADDGRGLNTLLTGAAGSSGNNPPTGGPTDTGSGSNSNGIDYERAARFRELRASGMSQADAARMVNQELPPDRTQIPIPAPDQLGEPEYQYDNRRSAEWNRLEREKQAIFADNSLSGLEQAQKWQKIRETDSRGITQYAADKYHGSRLEGGINKVGGAITNHGPVKWARSAGSSVKDMASRATNAIPKPIRNSIRGASTLAANAAKYAAPRAGKLALKGGLAATGAVLGASAGLASDNDKNIAAYGAIGAGVGWAAASGATGAVSSLRTGIDNTIQNARETYNSTAHGLDGQEALENARADKEFMKDKEIKKLYKDKLGLKSAQDVKRAMEAAQEYRRNGITDDKIIIKSMKLKDSVYGPGYNSQDKMIIAGLAEQTGNDNKKIKQIQTRLQERGISPEKAQKYIDGVRKVTKAI